jgi:hypothetical protein
MKPLSIAKEALKAVWNHKSLWLFGFFLAGSGAVSTRSLPQFHSTGAAPHPLPAWLPPVFVIAIIIAVGMLFFILTSEGALIDAGNKVKSGEATGVRSGVRVGLRAFWRVTGVKLTMTALLLTSAAVLAAPLMLALKHGVAGWVVALLALPLAAVAVPLFLTLHFVSEYGLRIAVLDGRGVMAAISEARVFLRGRVLESMQLLLVSALGRLGAAAAGLVAALPGAVVGLTLYFATHSIPLAAIVGGVIAAPFIACVIGASGTYGSMVWTLGFLESRNAAR